MKQQLLEELEALREVLRMARTPDDFDTLWARVQMIEALSASAVERSKSEMAALQRVRTVVSQAVRAHREGLDHPTSVSATGFALIQAVRRGTTGYAADHRLGC